MFLHLAPQRAYQLLILPQDVGTTVLWAKKLIKTLLIAFESPSKLCTYFYERILDLIMKD